MDNLTIVAQGFEKHLLSDESSMTYTCDIFFAQVFWDFFEIYTSGNILENAISHKT